jgi:hypothetical protein
MSLRLQFALGMWLCHSLTGHELSWPLIPVWSCTSTSSKGFGEAWSLSQLGSYLHPSSAVASSVPASYLSLLGLSFFFLKWKDYLKVFLWKMKIHSVCGKPCVAPGLSTE